MMDVFFPHCDKDGYYETGYFCYVFWCYCVLDKHGAEYVFPPDNLQPQPVLTPKECQEKYGKKSTTIQH